MHPQRTPVLFVAHGAPTLALAPGRWGEDVAAFAAAMPRPRAIAVVSAHWTTGSEVGVTSAAQHRLIYDFSGFPEALYRIRWPAPGAPEVAARVAALLEGAGFRARLDPVRGLDHGAWVPLREGWPEADVPVVADRPARGRARPALPVRGRARATPGRGGAPRGERRHRPQPPPRPVRRSRGRRRPVGGPFDAWVAERVAAGDLDGLARWRDEGPHAALAAPTPEHLDPLFVALGAQARRRPRRDGPPGLHPRQPRDAQPRPRPERRSRRTHRSTKGAASMKTVIALVAALVAPGLALADASTWNLDPMHTHAGFTVRHMVISNVRGEFEKTTGVVKVDDQDLSKSTRRRHHRRGERQHPRRGSRQGPQVGQLLRRREVPDHHLQVDEDREGGRGQAEGDG